MARKSVMIEEDAHKKLEKIADHLDTSNGKIVEAVVKNLDEETINKLLIQEQEKKGKKK